MVVISIFIFFIDGRDRRCRDIDLSINRFVILKSVKILIKLANGGSHISGEF